MHITLDRCELLSAARNAEKIAPPKSAVAALECVCLDAENDAVTVTSTNLELALAQRVPAEVQESGRMLVSAKWLSGALGVLRAGRVTLQHDAAGRVHILSGTTEYTLAAPAIGQAAANANRIALCAADQRRRSVRLLLQDRTGLPVRAFLQCQNGSAEPDGTRGR